MWFYLTGLSRTNWNILFINDISCLYQWQLLYILKSNKRCFFVPLIVKSNVTFQMTLIKDFS